CRPDTAFCHDATSAIATLLFFHSPPSPVSAAYSDAEHSTRLFSLLVDSRILFPFSFIDLPLAGRTIGLPFRRPENSQPCCLTSRDSTVLCHAFHRTRSLAGISSLRLWSSLLLLDGCGWRRSDPQQLHNLICPM